MVRIGVLRMILDASGKPVMKPTWNGEVIETSGDSSPAIMGGPVKRDIRGRRSVPTPTSAPRCQCGKFTIPQARMWKHQCNPKEIKCSQ